MSSRYPLEPLQRVRHVESERAQLALAHAVAQRGRAAARVAELEAEVDAHQQAAPSPNVPAASGAALRRAAAFAQRHAEQARALRTRLQGARAELQAREAELEASRRAVEVAAGAEHVLTRDRERFELRVQRDRERDEQRELDERAQGTRPSLRRP